MLLEGKTAIVTGSIQGIGRAVLIEMVKNGADAIACGQRETPEFTELAADLRREYGRLVVPVYFDFSDKDGVKAAVSEIRKAGKPIDILANVAGMTIDAFFPMVTQEQLLTVFQINFFSQIAFTQYIVKLMLRNGKGSIVNFSSVTGIEGNPGQLAYGAAKAAWVAATKTMSAELGPKGIRVNAVAPGSIATAMTADLPEDVAAAQIAKSSLRRFGQPDEVAKTVVFLASDRASYITGQIVKIDGGL
ncbi:MAG: SDR family oxidoreductase [Clostridiales Family XIII bacterium]|jgi:3-oxoacyl-[acyl-carrier protein] reductase|nr:SDR family oxidoreductase [Clostridiales Family XIII bacterium]